MAEIQAFRGLRYTPAAGELNELVCPPYDIISETQRQRFLEKNPHNIIRLELPEGGNDRYEIAGRTLKEWLQQGMLAQDTQDTLYLSEMEFTAYGQRKKVRGLICRVKLEPFEKGVVLPHEETLSKAKTDRFHLMSQTFCNFSQIYSLYRDEKNEISSLLSSSEGRGLPLMTCTDAEDTVYQVWPVTDKPVIDAVMKAFEDKKLYIADGHHRYETALKFQEYLRENGQAAQYLGCDSVMMMLVEMGDPGLVVFPTHRLVRNMDGFDPEKLLEKCQAYFEVRRDIPVGQAEKLLDEQYRQQKKAFVFYAGGSSCSLLILKDSQAVRNLLPEMSQAYCGLDVSVLHTLILERILGIDKENMARQINLTYMRDSSEAIQAVCEQKANCAFLLNPTRVEEIQQVALAGEKMPQKSTYFYPKLITGQVMNQL